MSWFTTLTDFPEFGDGWAAGWRVAVLAGLGGLLVRLMLRRRLTPGLAGPAWVLGSLAALNGWWGLPGVGLEARAGWIPAGLFLGLLALAGGVELAMHTPNPKAIGVLLAFPGAVIVGVASDFQGPGWVRPLVIATITLGAPMVADLDRRSARLALGPLLWLVTVIGVYATVPDTELVRPLVGVAIPVALLGFPIGLARLGGAGSAAAVGLLVWIGAQQGYGRPGSIVGVAAALGVFWAEPTGRSLLRRWVAPLGRAVRPPVLAAAVFAVHILLTWYGTRVVGFSQSGMGAAVRWVLALPVALVLGAWVAITRPRRRTRHRPTAAPPT